MKTKLAAIFIFISCLAFSQSSALQMAEGLVLPKDSIETKKVLVAFDEFLSGLQISNTVTPHIPDSLKAETYVLLDEIADCEYNEKSKDQHYYKPALISMVAMAPHRYLLQWQYAAVKESNYQLRAIFEILCCVNNEGVWFYSPLHDNAKNFQKFEKAGVTIYGTNTINKEVAERYCSYTAVFDKKLGLTTSSTHLYCFDNLPDMSKRIGVLYKSDYNGRRSGVWTANAGTVHVVVLGNKNSSFTDFDPHDLFHERLGMIKSRRTLYRPVDEGCAYLYGGSWGYTWPQILEAFKKMLSENKQVDWCEIKEKPLYFKTGEFSNSADYIVNALIIQKLEKEKGFDAVWQLLDIGPAEPGHEKYYAALEKLLGVQKQQYSAFVEQLIKNAK